MKKGRMEAFSDGVLAVIITIMVLELKVPHDGSLEALEKLFPVFLSYLLSFIYIGIYWNNHHHMLLAVQQIDAKVMWANFNLLFWLSLVPFATGWMGENHFTRWPIIVYGFVLFMAGVAYYILAHALIDLHGKNSTIAQAIGKDWKGIASVVIYLLGIGIAFFNPWVSLAMYTCVAIMWFVPDKRIEKTIHHDETGPTV